MIRLDLYLSNFGFVKSRQKAKALIEEGFVFVNSEKITKPATLVDEANSLKIEIVDPCPYVSRGGLKLEKVIESAKLQIKGKTIVDIGASTGGFTDCLLKHGANLVYAVDSGSNQLSESLKTDARVISIENYNARNINHDDIGEYCDIITIDVSFISQTYILPKSVNLLCENGIYVSLIKPQFEAGKDKIDKGGIVKKPQNRLFAVKRVIDCALENGLKCTYFDKSPILGGDGNIEYLAVFEKNTKKIISFEFIKNIILEK
ncbi:MAG: TlyA family RNA methyltransferase [Clostridia bacterium]|nr:TlyA family RNA methyltransferase [Clostridia bacterium]